MTPQTLPFAVKQSASSLLPDLLRALDGQGWVKAKRLMRILGTNDRVIREAARRSEGRIISGQRGYCLFEQAQLQEIDHAANWLISQGREMIKRGLGYRRRLHRRTA